MIIHDRSIEFSLNSRGAGRSSVLHELFLEDEGKLQHYQRERAPGGPLAPGKGSLVPFAITSGGLLAPSALALLKRFARARSESAPGDDNADDGSVVGIKLLPSAQRAACVHGSPALDGMRVASMSPLPSTVRSTGTRRPPGPAGSTISRNYNA